MKPSQYTITVTSDEMHAITTALAYLKLQSAMNGSDQVVPVARNFGSTLWNVTQQINAIDDAYAEAQAFYASQEQEVKAEERWSQVAL